MIRVVADAPKVRDREFLRVVEDGRSLHEAEDALLDVVDDLPVLIQELERLLRLLSGLRREPEEYEDVIEEADRGGIVQQVANIGLVRPLVDSIQNSLIRAFETPHDEAATRIVHALQSLAREIPGRSGHRAVPDIELRLRDRSRQLIEALRRKKLVHQREMRDSIGDVVFQLVDHIRNAVHPVGQAVGSVVGAEGAAPPITSTGCENRHDGRRRVVGSDIEVGEIGVTQQVQLSLGGLRIGASLPFAPPPETGHGFGSAGIREQSGQRLLTLAGDDEIDCIPESNDEVFGILEEECTAEDDRNLGALFDELREADTEPELLVVTDRESNGVGMLRHDPVGQLLDDHGRDFGVAVGGLEPVLERLGKRGKEAVQLVDVLGVAIGLTVELRVVPTAKAVDCTSENARVDRVSPEQGRVVLVERREDFVVIEEIEVDHTGGPAGRHPVDMALQHGHAERGRKRSHIGEMGENDPFHATSHVKATPVDTGAGRTIGGVSEPASRLWTIGRNSHLDVKHGLVRRGTVLRRGATEFRAGGRPRRFTRTHRPPISRR